MTGAMNFPACQSPEILVPILIFFIISLPAKAQSVNNPNFSSQNATSFQPSLAVVVGILCIMFSLTLILILYTKCCYHPTSPRFIGQDGLLQSRRFSGIDKTLIESLPFFRFSALKGTRDGLECAVCLAKFEDIEILRLLPTCKHAFHIDCIDLWLENHSSCPLCRHKVSEDDLVYTYSHSLRFLRDQSERKEYSDLEIFVQREEEMSSRFEMGKKEEEIRIQESQENDEILHKFNHKIIVSDGVFKNRWSNVSYSDLMYLKSEMINSISSNRFSPLDSNNAKFVTSKFSKNEETVPSPSDSNTQIGTSYYSSKELSYNEQRSMSEIVVHSRFTEFGTGNNFSSSRDVEDDRQRRLWLPIARRTVEWFTNRERSRPQQLLKNNTNESLDV